MHAQSLHAAQTTRHGIQDRRRQPRAFGLAFGLLGLLLSVTLVPVRAFAANTVPENQDTYIIAKHSGQDLSVLAQGMKAGDAIVQYTRDPNGAGHQVWQLKPVGDGSYYIVAKHSGQYLSVLAQGMKAGDAVVQYTRDPNGAGHQKWELKPVGDGSYYIIAKHSGQYLSVLAQGMKAGEKIVQYTLDPKGGDHQKWKLELVPGT